MNFILSLIALGIASAAREAMMAIEKTMNFFIFWGIVSYIILSIVVGFGAANRGRSQAGYTVLSLLWSPLFAGFVLLILGPLQETGEHDTSDSSDTASTITQSDIEHTEVSADAAYSTEEEQKISEPNLDYLMPNIGRVTEEEPKTWKCKHCGYENPAGLVLCEKCGEYS